MILVVSVCRPAWGRGCQRLEECFSLGLFLLFFSIFDKLGEMKAKSFEVSQFWGCSSLIIAIVSVHHDGHWAMMAHDEPGQQMWVRWGPRPRLAKGPTIQQQVLKNWGSGMVMSRFKSVTLLVWGHHCKSTCVSPLTGSALQQIGEVTEDRFSNQLADWNPCCWLHCIWGIGLITKPHIRFNMSQNPRK